MDNPFRYAQPVLMETVVKKQDRWENVGKRWGYLESRGPDMPLILGQALCGPKIINISTVSTTTAIFLEREADLF